MTAEAQPVSSSRPTAQTIRKSFSTRTAQMRLLLWRWQRSTAGAAAVEFALLAPMMSILFIGAVELSQVIAVNRRVTQIAGSTGDLVARADTQISQSAITDIMKVGGYVMEPYSQAPLQIILSNVTSSPADATNTKQSWMCTYKGSGGSGGTTTCSCTNTKQAIPPNLVTTNDSVVMAKVTYAYKPLLFDHFMKADWASSGGGTYTLARTHYLKPRSQAAMLLQSNNTPCPWVTFP
jgi:Flp pilus assembly protein TadG